MNRGRIAHWDAAKGYGFIMPDDDSDRVFVHASALSGYVPRMGDRVDFRTELDDRGRVRAIAVQILGRLPDRIEFRPRHECGQGSGDSGSFGRPVFALGFLVVLLGAALAGLTQLALAALYLAMSVLTFLFYVSDKRSAVIGEWRIPEKTLHFLELIGGWPGALFAQRFLHHKSSKWSYQVEFWIVTILNLSFYTWTFTEQGSFFAQSIFGRFSAILVEWLHRM